MKFEVTSFNTFEVMPRTRFHDAQTDRVIPVYPTETSLWGHKYVVTVSVPSHRLSLCPQVP